MSALFDRFLLPALLQGTLFAAFAALLDAVVGRRLWPRVRQVLWLAVFLKLLLPPALSSPVALAEGLPERAEAPGFAPAAWLLGSALFGAAAILRARAFRRNLAARPAPAPVAAFAARVAREIGLRRAPEILSSDALRSPCVVGHLRPAIVLPSAPVPALRHVLLHELAHVRRRDPLRAALLLALHVLFWPHPLLPLARRRAHAIREALCDASASRAAPDYARTLRAAARERFLGAAATAFHGSSILLRLRWLKSRAWTMPRLHAAAALLSALLLAACALPMGSRSLAPFRDSFAEAARAVLRDPRGQGCLRVRHSLLHLNQSGGNP